MGSCYKAIVLGASSGGVEALATLLPDLGGRLPIPVMIVIHLSPETDSFFAAHYQAICEMRIRVAEDKESVAESTVYFAPPGYHLLVEDENSLALSLEDRVNYARPSIDVLFESAAEIYQDRLIGIILTGANGDGALGLKRIQELGGLTIVQDPASAAVDIMPLASLQLMTPDHVVPLDQLGEMLKQMVFDNTWKKHRYS